MPFKKNVSGNPAGRPKGSVDGLRQKITDFITQNLSKIQQDYDSLKPVERLMFLEKLLRYSISPLQSIDLTQTIKREIEALPEEQLNQLADKIIHQNQN